VAGARRFALPHRGWLFDLDGTVYLGEALIPGADSAIAALRAAHRRVAFLSNKPLQSRGEYADKLTRLGIPAAADDVVKSSGVLARLAHLDPGAPASSSARPLVAERGPPPRSPRSRALGGHLLD
jgi:ribonucleotide monophosphatase NagD (HAD superfamily)